MSSKWAGAPRCPPWWIDKVQGDMKAKESVQLLLQAL